jgi:serine phosphatase RsbU (regulator of sigma subunit)
MRGRPDLRRLRDCLETSELCGILDEVAAAAAAGAEMSWSVVVPESGGGFSVLMGANGRAGPVEPGASAVLAAILGEGRDRLAAVPSPRPLRPGEPLVAAASTLSFRDRKYGLFLLHGDAAPDLAWWQEVVDALAPEVVKTQLYEAANRESATSAVKLDALHEAGELVKYVELDVLLTKLMELSVRIMRAEVGAIALLRDGRLGTGIEWGLSEEVLLGLRTPGGAPFVQDAIERGEAVLVEDAATSPSLDAGALGARLQSLVLVPLISQEKRLGAIVIVNPGGEEGLRREAAAVLGTIANLGAAAVDNAILYGKTREAERISAEMDMASSIQDSLLPSTYPENDALELRGWCMSASETGGDFYDFLDMGEERTGIVIGDATGHGMAAALLAFVARATLKALLTRSRSLPDVLRTMNDLVEADSEDDRFLTFFFGVFDHRSRILEFTSAGHDPPFVYRPATDAFLELKATGIPLGIFPGMPFPTAHAALSSGDFLVFGTDGIWEAADRRGRQYGKDRLRAAVRAHHARPLAEASDRIRADILAFHGGAERRDDITAVFMRVK